VSRERLDKNSGGNRNTSLEQDEDAAWMRMRGISDNSMAQQNAIAPPARPLRASESDGQLLLRSAAQRRSASGSRLLGLHQEGLWEQEGGWRPSSKQRRKLYNKERDASMVDLLNLIDPASLVDKRPLEDGAAAAASSSAAASPDHHRQHSRQNGLRTAVHTSGAEEIPRTMSGMEQHSALSSRGVALVGSVSALCWYMFRLLLRDGFGGGRSARQVVLELQALSSIHALGWVLFLAKKFWGDAEELPRYCSRALVASLGFYLHDCWALRSTLLSKPGMLLNQACMAVSIGSILRSKGVAWLAPFLMSLSIPTLMQEMLLLCGTFQLPANRPEVRALRLSWILSFISSKLALLPLWLRYCTNPELHQPNLLAGKVSYLLSLALNMKFMVSAARDLPRFLQPSGDVVPASIAYKLPLRSIENLGSSIVTSFLLVSVFGSYLVAPVGGLLVLLASRQGTSKFLRRCAWLLGVTVALDRILPMPTKCDARAPLVLPLLRQFCNFFRHKVYPSSGLDDVLKDKERSYLITLTPHGLFPWGVIPVLTMLLDKGYLPNFVGASVLGALPVAGRLLRLFGYCPATKTAIRKCLAQSFPRNVTIIVPGGIAEMFSIRADLELSAAAKRKGFMKLAKEKGAVVVPGFLFGNSQLYQVAQGPLSDIFKAVSRKLQMSLLPFHGLWGTLLPYPHRLATAFGEPVDTRNWDTADQAHDVWKKNLRNAYQDNRSQFGWPDRQLYFEGEGVPPPPLQDPLWEYTALPRLSRL